MNLEFLIVFVTFLGVFINFLGSINFLLEKKKFCFAMFSFCAIACICSFGIYCFLGFCDISFYTMSFSLLISSFAFDIYLISSIFEMFINK